MERRLAAILAADVAGYSALMNADEDATYNAWRSARNQVIDPSIEVSRGRIVKHTGDGFLAEFPTVLAAVECAVDIQRKMESRSQSLVNGLKFQFRIGINLGDVIVDTEDIHGDGVNIAARLESIAEAGGICVSADVYRQVRNKPGFEFEDLGEHSVKNIASPIQVYRITGGPPERAAATDLPPDPAPAKTPVETAGRDFTDMLENIAGREQRPATLVVGRQAEKKVLAEALDEARRGSGNIALIRGEPGIGKSCLASTFAESVEDENTWIFYGQCHETLGSPPFWPWLQILKALQLIDDSQDLSPASIFESLVSAESQPQNRSASLFTGDGGAEQFRLFTKIANLLFRYASRRTLVLVIDDLHWADRSSLLLLNHLCRNLSGEAMLVIGTYRDIEVTRKHPLFEALSEINRLTTLRRIHLKGLSEQDVTGYIESTVNEVLPPEILKSLYEKTEGNPLFVSEVARMLQQERNNLTGNQWIVEIPEGIQEAIGRRLNQLSEPCNELLSLAAVIGRKFNLQVLNKLVPDSEQLGLLDALEEAVNRGMIEERQSALAEFQFCHVLIRDILYEELSLAKKILLHKRVADALVELRNERSDYSAGEIARHYYQALQGGQGVKAVDYALEAAKHAEKMAAFDEAIGYYELALDVISVDEGHHLERRPQIYFDIAMCKHALGVATQSGLEAYYQCIEVAREQKDYKVFADAACRIVYVGRAFKRAHESLRTIEEALSYLDDDDLATRANTMAHHSMALSFNNRRREAERVAKQAVEVAVESGDANAHSNALCMALLVLRGRPEKLSERIRLGEHARALSKEADSTGQDSLEWLILSYQEKGDMTRVRELISDLEIAVSRSLRFKSRYFVVGAEACLALFDGRWEHAESRIEEAGRLGVGKLDGGAEGVFGAQMFLLNRELGRLPMVKPALEKILESGSGIWKPGLLATLVDLGLADEATAIFDELVADNFRCVAEDELYQICLVYLIEACFELNRGELASALYQRLVPYSGQMVSHPTAVCYGPADLYLGMLASQMNHLSEAEELFQKAMALCEKSAPNMWQAHIKYRHAQVLKRHNFSGGKAGFDELVEGARKSAQSLGMVNLLAKLVNLERAGALENEEQNIGLTRRELEVLRLIAQGKSNKHIASDLNRSLATVATHVRSILSKTHTANRTEAAAFATEHNLCDKPTRH